jgi:hypothetical protein
MTVTVTARLGVYRWTADPDAFTRAQLDASHASLEQVAAKYTEGTDLPSPAATHARSFFFKTNTQILYHFRGSDQSGTWVPVNSFGGTIQGLTYGGSSSSGSSQFAARADHVHALPAAIDTSTFIQRSFVDAKGDLIAATANDTIARLPVGTSGQVLVANPATATGLQWVVPVTTATTTTLNGFITGNGSVLSATTVIDGGTP